MLTKDLSFREPTKPSCTSLTLPQEGSAFMVPIQRATLGNPERLTPIISIGVDSTEPK